MKVSYSYFDDSGSVVKILQFQLKFYGFEINSTYFSLGKPMVSLVFVQIKQLKTECINIYWVNGSHSDFD